MNKPPLKVMLYSDAEGFAGGERYLLELARGLAQERVALLAVAATGTGADPFVNGLQELGVPVHRLPPVPRLGRTGAFLRVARFFLNHRRALLHFNLVDPRACNGAMTAARAALRGRFVVTEHLPESPFDDKPLPLRHRIAQRSTAVTIVNSEAHRDVVLRRPGNRSRVVVIPNGMPDSGPPVPERREAARAALGLPGHEGPLVGLVGRLVPQKNPDLFLEGVRRVAPRHAAARFVILGDGPELEALRAKAASLGLDDAVLFLGHREDAAELVYGLDLLVSTSRYEGQPFAVLEAMIRGVPAVVQDTPGMSDLVADRACGRVVAPEDGDVLGDTLDEALADPYRLARWGQVARERAVTLFSVPAMCRRTLEVYESLKAGPVRTAP